MADEKTDNPTPKKSKAPNDKPVRRDRWWKRYLRRLVVLVVLLVIVGFGALLAVQLVLWSGLPRSIAESTIRSQTGLDTHVGSVEVSLLGGVKVRDVELSLPEAAIPVALGATRPALMDEPEPFARVDSIDAKLPALPLVAVQFLTGKPAVELVDIDGITLDLRQYDDGTWNAVRIAEQVQRSQAKPQPQQPTSDGLALPVSLPLPKVDLRNIAIHVRDQGGKEATISPINVLAESTEPLHWDFQVELPSTNPDDGGAEPRVAEPRVIRGELVPAGRFDHLISIELPDITALAQPLLNLPGVTVSMNWVGDLAKGIDGNLHINEIKLLDTGIAVRGNLRAAAGGSGGTAVVRVVDGLTISNVPQIGEVVLQSGKIALDGDTVTLTNGSARLLDGVASIRSASFNLTTLQGSADVNLDKLVYAGNSLNGDAKLTVSESDIDGLNIKLDGTFNGKSSAGPYAANLKVVGRGRDQSVLNWTVDLTDGQVQGDGSAGIAIPALSAKATTTFTDDLQQVLLRQLKTTESGLVNAQGGVTLSGDHPVWWFYGAIDGLNATLPRLPAPQNQVTLAGHIDVWGELPHGDATVGDVTDGKLPETAASSTRPADTGQRIRIKSLYATGAGLVLWGDGEINPGGAVNEKEPGGAAGDVAEVAADVLPLHLQLNVKDDGSLIGDSELFDGNIRGNLTVDGILDKNSLTENWAVTFDGGLQALNLRVSGQPLNDIGGKLTGRVDSDMLELHTQDVEGFGGTALLEIFAPLNADEPIRVHAKANDIDLAQVASIASLPLVGTLDQADINVVAPELTVDALSMDGTFGLVESTPGTGIMAGPLVAGQSITGNLRMRGFDLSADDVVITSVNGGKLTASAGASLKDLTRLTLNATADDYLVNIIGIPDTVNLVISDLDVDNLVVQFVPDVLLPSIDGKVRVAADVQLNQLGTMTDFAEVTIDANAKDRRFDVDKILVSLKTAGQLQGSGSFPFDDPTASDFRIGGQNLDMTPLITRFGADSPLSQITGVWNVDVHLRPAEVPRPLAPLQLDVNIDVDDGTYKGMNFTGMDIRAFADLSFYDEAKQPAFVFRKFVTQYAAIQMADGIVDSFVRVSRKVLDNPDQTQTEYLQSQAKIEIGLNREDTKVPAPLSIAQLIDVADVDTGNFNAAGLASGQLSAFGDALRFSDAIAEIQLQRAATRTASEEFTKPAAASAITGSGRIDLSRLSISGSVANKLGAAPIGGDEIRGDGGGTISFDLYQGDFVANNIDVFTNGIQIRGSVTVKNALFLADPPLDGTIIALARPLRDVDLPFFGNADDLLTAIQASSGVTAFRVTGTLTKPDVVPITLAEIGDTTRKLLVNDAKDAQ